ncbi:MAG: DUF2110 family protein [Promethearchaeota archaeon]
MKTLILLDKFYRYRKDFDKKYETYLSKALIQLIKERIKDFKIDIDLEYMGMHSPGNRPIIAMAGKDEEFIYNYLKKEFGTVYKFSELNTGQIIRGRMKNPDSVNFGIFIDCGVESPVKDVLLPHFSLRNQLANGNKIPKKKICNAFGFYEEMPIYVKITKIDKSSKEIECEIAEETVKMFKTWISDGFEILFSIGSSRKRVKKAIKRTKHYPDYLTIERQGFLETAIFLKMGTHAPGILSEIGPLLKDVRFSMFLPKKILNLV